MEKLIDNDTNNIVKKYTKQIINVDVINYLYAFVQVYVVFILNSVGMTAFGIATVLTIKSVSVFILSYIFGKYRPKISDNNDLFKHVPPIALIEILAMILMVVSLILNQSFYTAIFLIIQQVAYNVKRMEYDLNLVKINKNVNVGNIFMKKQVKIETGWGIGVLTIGMVVSQLKTFPITTNIVMAIVIVIAIVINAINILSLKKVAKGLSGIRFPSEHISEKHEKLKLTHIGLLSIVLLCLTYSLCASKESITTEMLNRQFNNAEQMFGYMTAIGCLTAVVSLKAIDYYSDKYIKNKKQYFIVLLGSIIALTAFDYILLVTTPLSPAIILIATLLGSVVSLLYGNLIPILSIFNPTLKSHTIVSITSLIVATATTIYPYSIYYSLLSNYLLYSVTLGLLIIILIYIFVVTKKE